MAGDEPGIHSKPQLPLDGVDMWDTISNDKPGRDEILGNLYLQSMIRGSNAHEFLEKRDVSIAEVQEDKEDESVTMEPGDYFSLRWKNWKIMTGTYLSQGWIKEDQIKKDKIENNEYKDSSKDGSKQKFENVTMLFDLSKDPRETTNVASENPDVVKP